MKGRTAITTRAVERSLAAGHNQWLTAEEVADGRRDAHGNTYVPVLLDRTDKGLANWFVVRVELGGRTVVVNSGHPFARKGKAETLAYALAAGNVKDWPS